MPCAAAAATLATPAEVKTQLLDLCQKTKRGASTSAATRGEVEELQVALESFQGAQELDYELLGGLWELQWTTANDVLPIINWDTVLSGPWGKGPLRAGKIYQRFTVPKDGAGQVDNVIKFSLPLLQEREGVTLTVNARYQVRSGHVIALQFASARVSDVRISELAESLLTPAVLPRVPLQGKLLMAIREFILTVPFRNLAEVSSGVQTQVGLEDRFGAGGGAYQLTYLDQDVLVGRAVTLGNSFIFTRARAEA